MPRLFRPPEEYILAAGALRFVVLLGCMLKCCSELVRFPFVERGISTVIWILGCYHFY
jgi:hypothetical protein